MRVSTSASVGAVPLVKSCKTYRCGYAKFLSCVFPSFFFFFFLLPPRKSLDRVSDILKTWQDYRKVARLGVFVYLKKESCTFSTFSHRYFFIRAIGGLSQPSKRKSKAPEKHTRGMWTGSKNHTQCTYSTVSLIGSLAIYGHLDPELFIITAGL